MIAPYHSGLPETRNQETREGRTLVQMFSGVGVWDEVRG
jgi:hypothetical protein